MTTTALKALTGTVSYSDVGIASAPVFSTDVVATFGAFTGTGTSITSTVTLTKPGFTPSGANTKTVTITTAGARKRSAPTGARVMVNTDPTPEVVETPPKK